MNGKTCNINKHRAHARAVALIAEDFFWNPTDQLAPFGSDEGDTGLILFREWRREHPVTPTIEYLKKTIELVGEMALEDYNETLLDRDLIIQMKEDPAFDDYRFIFTLDVLLIAAGFGQLADEGVIEDANKAVINTALERQIAWAQLTETCSYAEQHIGYLNILKQVLEEA